MNITYRGVLTKVYDNTTSTGKSKWVLFVNTDEKGFVKFQLWDKKYVGIASENNPAICDVHDWTGKRIVFEAKPGKPKADDPDDCWPPTIELISLEEEAPAQTVREMAEEFDRAEPGTAEIESEDETVPEPAEEEEEVLSVLDDLRRLTKEAMHADLCAHEAKAAWLEGVERMIAQHEKRST